MKKLYVIMLVLMICGCKQSSQIGDDVEIDIIESEYDGHQYIIFSGHGVIHNPDCSGYE